MSTDGLSGYYTSEGYRGRISAERTMLFPTYDEYAEYMSTPEQFQCDEVSGDVFSLSDDPHLRTEQINRMCAELNKAIASGDITFLHAVCLIGQPVAGMQNPGI